MKALIPALFLALTAAAQAETATLCRAVGENAYPVQQVSLQWGERIPESDGNPFFRNWSQKVAVTISGLRYYQTYQAVAAHSSHSTRLGQEHSIMVKLSESDRIYLRNYPELYPAEHRKLRAAFLALNEGTPGEKQIQLDCQ